MALRRRCFVDVAAALPLFALFFFFFCTAFSSTTSPALLLASAQPVTLTVPPPPAWIQNKTEWRIRLYNSLRLTPSQVQLLEGALDALDALKAPLTLAADAALLAAANETFAAKRPHVNSSFYKSVVSPLEKHANKTVVGIEEARVRLLNKTEIALRAGASAVSASSLSSSSSSSPSFFHPLATSPAALLLAQKLNVSADAVAKRIATLTTIQQYRAAAAVAKAGASGTLRDPLPAIHFSPQPEQVGTSSAVASKAELGPSPGTGAEQLDWTPLGPDGQPAGGGGVIRGGGGRGPPLSSSSSTFAAKISSLLLPPHPEEHPSWLVHAEEDAEIAEWVASKPRMEKEEGGAEGGMTGGRKAAAAAAAAAEKQKQQKLALRLAEWIEAAPASLREDLGSDAAAAEDKSGGEFVTINAEVRF